MKLSQISDAMIRRMPPESRKVLGSRVMTSEEAQEAFVAKSEKELQKQLAQLLSLRGIWFDCDAMHKRRMGSKGAADFQFPYAGKWVSWEAKHDKGALSKDQEKVRDAVIRQGGEWRLIRSVDEARGHLDEMNNNQRN